MTNYSDKNKSDNNEANDQTKNEANSEANSDAKSTESSEFDKGLVANIAKGEIKSEEKEPPSIRL